VGASTYAGSIWLQDDVDFPDGFVVLQSLSTSYARAVTSPANAFGTTVPFGSWLVWRATAGWHTYRFLYNSAGGGANVCFRNRRLHVGTF
jgi:hypothetical protein